MQKVYAGGIPRKFTSGLIDANAMPYVVMDISVVNTAIRMV